MLWANIRESVVVSETLPILGKLEQLEATVTANEVEIPMGQVDLGATVALTRLLACAFPMTNMATTLGVANQAVPDMLSSLPKSKPTTTTRRETPRPPGGRERRGWPKCIVASRL